LDRFVGQICNLTSQELAIKSLKLLKQFRECLYLL